VVFLGHLPHGSVSADELAGRDLQFELPAEVQTPFLFGLASTIRYEDVGTRLWS
jgi:hypothetical protein